MEIAEKWIYEISNWIVRLREWIKWDIISLLWNELKDLRENIVSEAKKYIWYPSILYKNPLSWMDNNGFDCSWFVTFILTKFGLNKIWIRHANEYFDQYWILIHKKAVNTWDLVFFSYNWLRPTHVWIMISQDKCIHAPWKENTKIETSNILSKKIKIENNAQIYYYNPIWFKRITLELSEKNMRRPKII